MRVPSIARPLQLTLVEQYRKFEAIGNRVDERMRMSVRGGHATVDLTEKTSSAREDDFHW
jgi:hypothetical protein